MFLAIIVADADVSFEPLVESHNTLPDDKTFAAAGPRLQNYFPVQLRNPDITYIRTVQTTAEGTPFSGSMNTMALCDFDMRRLRRTLTYLFTYLQR